MQTAISAAAAPAQTVGKKELCAHLKWSRPTLDRRLERDSNFPVRTRGSALGGWAFEIAAVEAYLNTGLLSATDDAPIAAGEPAAKAKHQGEATAKQRLTDAQAQLAEDRLRRQRGDLVEVAPLQMKLAAAVTKLSSSLNALPDTIGRRLRLPEAAIGVVRQEVEDARRAFHAELRELLSGE